MLAALCYVVFFLPFLIGEKHDPFVKYHMKQGIGFLIAILAFQGAIKIIYEWGFYELTTPLAWILRVALILGVIIGAMNAFNDKTTPLPIIGKYAEKF